MHDPTYFTSCNDDYLQRFLRSFISSSVDAEIKNNFIIDICPSTPLSEDSKNLINEVKSTFDNFKFVSIESNCPLDGTWPSKKTYYACRRFLLLPELLIQYKNLWVTDIDVMFLKEFPLIQSQLAYSLSQERPKTGSKNYDRRVTGVVIKGDMIYMDERFYNQSIRIREHILSSDRKWYVDQMALYEVFKDVKDYQLVPRSSMKRSELSKWNHESYLISPGGTYKKKDEVIKDFDHFNERYAALINR